MQKTPIVTIAFIIVCVVVTFLANFGANLQIANYLFFSLQPTQVIPPEWLQGELWRMVSPIFLHVSYYHIFYMVWLYLLGKEIELAYSSQRLIVMCLLFGVIGNFAQYYATDPRFAGSSGVVFGLIAYTWAHSRWMPKPKITMSEHLIILVFILIIADILLYGEIAHWAHLGGAAAGLMWAKCESERAKKNHRKRDKRDINRDRHNG